MAETATDRRPRYLFVNENIGGHRTVHTNIRRLLAERPDVDVDFLDVPAAAGLRRWAGVRLPGLALLDADLQAARAQTLAADWVYRRLRLMRHHYDAIHFYTHNSALRSTSLMRRVPSVISSDSTNLLNASRMHGRTAAALTPMATRPTAALERAAYRQARMLRPSSRWVRDDLIVEYGVDPQRIKVRPMGIILPDSPPQRAERPRPRIGFVGNPFARKGGELLLTWFAQRWREVADLVLVTASPVPPMAGVEVISDLRPGDQRLWQILSEIDIFAFPSMIDQAPNAVMEAMAAGLPVVAFAVAALPEMIEDGRSGILAEPGDERGFADAVDRLVHDAPLRRGLGRNARLAAQRHFDMRESLNDLLEDLASCSWQHPGVLR